MSLKLTSVKVGGERYKVGLKYARADLERKRQAHGRDGRRRSRAGAIVGGLAGGKKGALVGGLAGGGAGTAGSAFTGDADITLPAETVLIFIWPSRSISASRHSQLVQMMV